MKKKWFRKLPALLLALALVAVLLPGKSYAVLPNFYTGVGCGNGTVTTKWSGNTVTVNQDSEENGVGRYASPGTSVTVTAKPASGYVFVKWVNKLYYYRTMSTSATATFTTPSKNDASYFALFAKPSEVVQLKISCDSVAGKVCMNNTTDPEIASYYVTSIDEKEINNTDINLFAKANDGYTFVGWNTKADGSGTMVSTNRVFGTTITGDTILYAIFKSNSTPGDVNGDGNIDSDDAMLVLKYYVGSISASDLKLEAADVNGDNTVDSDDAMLILKYYVGSITQFPVT